MIVLSLFDGISCARVALEKLGLPIEKYYASEVDKYAIQINQKNFPDTIQLGSVTDITKDTIPGKIDLIIGGSPCQDLSIANNKRKGLDGSRSGLFWHFVRLIEELQPKYFMLENVASMPKESKDIISAALGVRPIMINASLVSAQNRKRLFWTNIVGVTLPKDRHIYLKDILEDEVGERFILKPSSYERLIYRGVTHTSQTQIWDDYNRKGFNEKCPTLTLPHHNTLRVVSPSGYVIENRHNNQSQMDRVYDDEGKSPPLLCAMVPMIKEPTKYKKHQQDLLQTSEGKCRTIPAGTHGSTPHLLKTIIIKEPTKQGYKEMVEGQGIDLAFQTSETHRGRVNDKSFTLTCASCAGTFQNGYIRKLTPTECERLQGLKDNYTEGISDSQRYKCLGNAFHVDVVAHILSFMNGEVKYDYSEQTRLFE